MGDNEKKLVSYLILFGKIFFGVASVMFILMLIVAGVLMRGATSNPLYWLIFIAWIYAFIKIYDIH